MTEEENWKPNPGLEAEHVSKLALLDEIVLGSARGGKNRPGPCQIDFLRSLERADLPLLIDPPKVAADPSRTLQIRSSHHQLARLLAEGHSQAEVSLISGYSPCYISTLKGDPAFSELLAYYGTQKEQIFVDYLERMKTLGLNTLEEIQARLASEPESWTKRELMELAELMLVKGKQQQGAGASSAGGPGVTVNVKFVSSVPAGDGPIIDMEPG